MGYAAEHKYEMRAAHKVRKLQTRQAEQARRKEARMGSTGLYIGPVKMAPMGRGKSVRAVMSGHWYTRETTYGRLSLNGLAITGQRNIVVLRDARVADAAVVIAEIIDTGKDIRVHLFRCREVRGGVQVPELTICTRETSPIMPSPIVP